MNRVYHTWDKWECYPAGFFEVNAPKGLTDDDCVNRYSELLRDIPEFIRIMRLIIDEWTNSCEHNLSNERMNRIAWMGQAALCYKYKIPARFRGGYNLLSESEREDADKAALQVINEWMVKNGHPILTFETVKSKTEMDLY